MSLTFGLRNINGWNSQVSGRERNVMPAEENIWLIF